MRDIHATHDMFAVSAKVRESAINTYQTLDTTLLFDIGDIAKLDPRRETNENQAIGKEEPDFIYDRGALSLLPFNVSMCTPQHLAFLMAYGLGSCSSAALGDGYKHTTIPIEGALDNERENPSFSLGHRIGKTVGKILLASMFVNNFKLSFKEDDWVKANGNIIGTGKHDLDVISETISAAGNAVSLTLAANGVTGSTAASRLDNVQEIKVELTTGVWTQVAYSAVSGATPAVITITSPGGTSGNVNYKVLYRPTEDAWGTFPVRVDEDALNVSKLAVIHGGKWTGAAFSGGRTVTSEISQIDWEFNNNGKCKFVPGAGGDYAGKFSRTGRSQKVTINREFREYIMQQHITDNDTFGLYLKAEGDLYDATYKYQAEIIFPKCGVMKADPGVNDKRLNENVELQVLEDDTYGSVIGHVQNLCEKYAAAS